MKPEKYLSVKSSVNGFSFANLGLFTGFGDGIISAVYSLILLDIFKSSEIVGIYSAAYFGFGLIVQLFFGEIMRIFSKSKIFYTSLLSIVVCYIMLSFSVKPATFIALDFFTAIPLVFIGTLIPLFMSDFAGRDGVARMNGRYHTWLNVGYLFAPMIAMFIAANFGNRSAFFASAVVYLFGLIIFKQYKIVQEQKAIPKLSPRRTFHAVIRGIKSYFIHKELSKAYIINFGFNAMKAMRLLYMPIIIIESGFSKDTLGLILTLGILPYVLLSDPIGNMAKKYGKNITKYGLAFGFIGFSICAFLLYFAKDWWMLALFVIWQIFGAIQESLHDMLFFDNVKKQDQSRFWGIFITSNNLPKVFAPLIAALFIFIFGGTSAAWIATGIIGILTTIVLLWKPKNFNIKGI